MINAFDGANEPGANGSDVLSRGVYDVADRITDGLQRFIEAGYHLRDEALISERQELLREVGAIRQEPYLEATPAYRSTRRIRDLAFVPDHVKDGLEHIVDLELGLYDPPYEHQARAVERYFEGLDLIVATGTGSGKTEAFLSAAIGSLLIEAKERPRSAEMRGVRALFLYPMNALVNDQIFRIRKLIGDSRLSGLLERGSSRRPVTFGSYTSRTAYHGRRTKNKDRDRVGKPIESYYLRLEKEQPDLVAELKRSGRWPSKDLGSFFAANQESRDAGGRLRDGHWDRRLFTSATDCELLTRHEMLSACPDILVTNYSMLEYMLLRPFERPIFKATATWLEEDSQNELIIVLDEAHLYRGASGAEVALLLRRLAGRLGVSRDRLRFILTTASIGTGKESDERAISFASALTGLEACHVRRFALIRGSLDGGPAERRTPTSQQVTALSTIDVHSIQEMRNSPNRAAEEIARLANAFHWPTPPGTVDGLADYLGAHLRGLEPLEVVIEAVSGTAVPLESLPELAFGGNHSLSATEARAATAALLALAAAAKERGRNVLPARLHLFFRGLPGLYACCNPECDVRRSAAVPSPLGRMYAEPRLSCSCAPQGRVFEVLSHRDCGAAFLQGFVQGAHGAFVWNEAGAGARRMFADRGGYTGSRLVPIEMLIDGDPHDDVINDCKAREAWLDIRTGRLVRELPDRADEFKKVWIPNVPEPEARGIRFKPCPVCQRDWRETSGSEGLGLSKIEPHATLGENPFTALTTAQLLSQPESLSPYAAKQPSRYPNKGRKVLVFSDGRQKAARLARDMPRMIQRDAFRQVIALAVRALESIAREATPNQVLYTAILSILSESDGFTFRGPSGPAIADDIRRYRRDFGREDLTAALLEGGFTPAAEEYRVAVLEQLGGRYYSLADATAGWVEPARRPLRRVLPDLATARPELAVEETALTYAYAWMSAAVDGYAIDESVPPHARARAAGFGENRADWGGTGKFRSPLRKGLARDFGWSENDIAAVEGLLAEAFMHGAEKRFLNPATSRVRIDLSRPWYRCTECFILEPMMLDGMCCAQCGAKNPVELEPSTDPYLRARKGYWREPIIAALSGAKAPATFQVAEHTAQLGHREYTRVHSTTERYELRFQDILIDRNELPVDVLSCTTTMEVGVDIGSLVAVALRNIPPERSNYQQRAGRAGRRGTGVSTVVTYGDRGPHGSYYFGQPQEIIAGPVRDPDVQVNNAKLARRHVNAILIQTYVASLPSHLLAEDASLETSLGVTHSFFSGEQEPTLNGFRIWVDANVTSGNNTLADKIASWLPHGLDVGDEFSSEDARLRTWVQTVARDFIANLTWLSETLPRQEAIEVDPKSDEDENPDESSAQRSIAPYLLEFLFDANLLPTYSFPTDLAAFVVDDAISQGGYSRVKVREMPQQSMSKAISEYAPGRLIVIDAATYRSGGVAARAPFTELDRARRLFEELVDIVSCDDCGYLRVLSSHDEAMATALIPCRTCGATLVPRQMIQPEVYTPEGRDELPDDDREQDLTYATSAQFPLPADGDVELESRLAPIGANLQFTHATDQQLVAVNKGASKGPHANAGFFVCVRCGLAQLEAPKGRRHPRTYHVQGPSARNMRDCTGSFRRVVLGHRFVSDVLLLRVNVSAPLTTDLTANLEGRIMEDALASAAESLLISASRTLDIDPQEFGVGYRIVPKPPGLSEDIWRLDVYLYDTLSGGAGYAEMASRNVLQILTYALNRLETCSCQRSCTKCLSHFRNQHIQGRLDRKLGARLLRWAIEGSAPAPLRLEEQWDRLSGLRRLLQLDSIALQKSSGAIVARFGGRDVAVDVWPSLLDRRSQSKSARVSFDEYILERDLPFAHEQIREALGL